MPSGPKRKKILCELVEFMLQLKSSDLRYRTINISNQYIHTAYPSKIPAPVIPLSSTSKKQYQNRNRRKHLKKLPNIAPQRQIQLSRRQFTDYSLASVQASDSTSL
ncbi:predicted protein [Sclerotinia sclerotiorum 1980 UF-70]|uniref:Uncharacterized protein n=1 Tax=Sclerotinia sclerotiorum (strain ATCC 18683 / 1980 / Ss-1) TaxID=665079 RepID=A7F989_SCLS1|nr:predicted protein [Sclerotinia sclerotiorum 1980 UF-70]EDO00300.1 predicted protein [Sclerotinia sclerotiorum 1980 UF-70]